MHVVYIIYSLSTDRYYVGQSEDPLLRLDQHNLHLYKGSFTSIATDWKLFYQLVCNSKRQALDIEAHIKRMKSRKYIENMKKYPAITEKPLLRYQ